MTKWISDMSIAPTDSEWVLGTVYIDENDPECGTVSEVIICDDGTWTNTAGLVVNPIAWSKIEPYRPSNKSAYDWEGAVKAWFDDTNFADCAPSGFCILGIAVGHVDACEGALIVDLDPEIDSAMWNADVMKDIKRDASVAYEQCLSDMRKHFR